MNKHAASIACLDDDAQGEPLEVLWERKMDGEPRVKAWTAALRRDLDDPRLFSAWLHTLGWSCVTSTRPELFQPPPWVAGIEVKASPPPRKALRLPRVNLFIADDVGPGKSIEAGPHPARAAHAPEGAARAHPGGPIARRPVASTRAR